MEDLREKLIERQKQLTYELEKIGEIIATLDELTARSDSALNVWRWKDIEMTARNLSTGRADTKQEQLVSNTSAPVDNSEVTARPRAKAKNDLKPAALVRKVHDLLMYNGKPMTRTELLKELDDHGIVIRGYNPSKVLGTTIWRARNTFISIPGHGYWITDRDCPSVGYKAPNQNNHETD